MANSSRKLSSRRAAPAARRPAPELISTLAAALGLLVAAVREERRRELFLEGQRLSDIVRFNLTLSPAAGQPFPVKGGLYGPHQGSQACFPLPDLERNNNPNF